MELTVQGSRRPYEGIPAARKSTLEERAPKLAVVAQLAGGGFPLLEALKLRSHQGEAPVVSHLGVTGQACPQRRGPAECETSVAPFPHERVNRSPRFTHSGSHSDASDEEKKERWRGDERTCSGSLADHDRPIVLPIPPLPHSSASVLVCTPRASYRLGMHEHPIGKLPSCTDPVHSDLDLHHRDIAPFSRKGDVRHRLVLLEGRLDGSLLLRQTLEELLLPRA